MEQYIKLCKDILNNGIYKQPAREGMPGTKSLFGYQMGFNLSEGFPLLTTKQMFFKGVVIELIWFLRGDTNIKFLIDNGVNIWNDDAYNYYKKRFSQAFDETFIPMSKESFINTLKNHSKDQLAEFLGGNHDYDLGDCGNQYGRVWRNFGHIIDGNYSVKAIDQIQNLINGLLKNPDSRRHIVTAIDPLNDDDLALYWCHAMMQFNCRALEPIERIKLAELWYPGYQQNDWDSLVPKHYLDCQLYQRSADTFLGVPFNIASYALLTHIIAEICNMRPGYFIHTFGDVHIYENHFEQVELQITRKPLGLPKIFFGSDLGKYFKSVRNGESVDVLFDKLDLSNIGLDDYTYHEKIKGKLSTGTGK